MLNENILKNDEKAVFALRSLYKSYGYSPFKMSKFEEYDLYVRNKDFLVGDSVITFNDTNGKLLAMKPDVTLSIIKNTVDGVGIKRKVFYNENVYRVSPKTHQFKEIMQTGIECIGDIDITDVYEVVFLAAKSLAKISQDFVLDISHLGIHSAILDEITDNKVLKREITKLISEKNIHEAIELCEKNGISKEKQEHISALINTYGTPECVISSLDKLCGVKGSVALSELKTLCDLLSKTEFKDRIRIDFSVVNDMRYYDGIVFKGFLNGIAEDVLSGGEYAPLMRRMGRKSNAIGFAFYTDILEELNRQVKEYDVDVILIYETNTAAETVISYKEKIIGDGKSVLAAKVIPQGIRCREVIKLSEESAND